MALFQATACTGAATGMNPWMCKLLGARWWCRVPREPWLKRCRPYGLCSLALLFSYVFLALGKEAGYVALQHTWQNTKARATWWPVFNVAFRFRGNQILNMSPSPMEFLPLKNGRRPSDPFMSMVLGPSAVGKPRLDVSLKSKKLHQGANLSFKCIQQSFIWECVGL